MNGKRKPAYISLIATPQGQRKSRKNSVTKFGKDNYELDMFYSSCGVRITGVTHHKATEQFLRW